jgi:serine/threonine protein kinase/N-acetylneuraminic acid mutarotase
VPDLWLDRVVGSKYRIVSIIGRGGMATVYSADQLNVPRRVAIKMADQSLTRDARFVQRFRREVAATASLEHEPHILPVYDVGDEDQLLYIVMPFISGGTLKDRLEEMAGRPWPAINVLNLSTQVLSALQYAHERGFVHRDVKPSNILLEGPRAYLADFGIAKAIHESGAAEGLTNALTITGSAVIGTPTYMAPEQALGQPLDGRADIYAFGVVVYELLTGKVPYTGTTPLEVAFKHVQSSLPPPRQLNPALSPATERVLVKALGRDPRARYASAADFARDLDRALGVQAEGATSPYSDTAPTVVVERQQVNPRPDVRSMRQAAAPRATVEPPTPAVPTSVPDRHHSALTRRNLLLLGATAVGVVVSGGILAYTRLPTDSRPAAPPDMRSPRGLFTLTPLASGDVLAAGGQEQPNTGLARAERFNEASNTWTIAGQMAMNRVEHTATLVPGGQVVVAGGRTGTSPTDLSAQTEQYDPSANAWSPLASMSSPRLLHSAVLLPGGHVLVIGGFSGTEYLQKVERFDPSSNRWMAASDMAAPRVAAASVLLHSGEVLVAGGFSGAAYLSTAERYNPTTDQWTPAGEMATPRAWHTATALQDGRALFIGGYIIGDQRSATFFSSAEVYDPQTNAWQPADPMSTARTAHTATLLSDGQVLVAGGQNAVPLASVEIFDPSSAAWTLVSSMPVPRTQHQAALLPSGDVLVAGGQIATDNAGSTATAERYDPRVDLWSLPHGP